MAESTRRNAASSTSASTLMRAPSGNPISITPRRPVLFASRRGFCDLIRVGASATRSMVAARAGSAACWPALSSTKAIGMNVSGSRRAVAGLRRSGQPSRARRIHLKTRLALRPCRRADFRYRSVWGQRFRDDPLSLLKAPGSSPKIIHLRNFAGRFRTHSRQCPHRNRCPPHVGWTPNQIYPNLGRRSLCDAYRCFVSRTLFEDERTRAARGRAAEDVPKRHVMMTRPRYSQPRAPRLRRRLCRSRAVLPPDPRTSGHPPSPPASSPVNRPSEWAKQSRRRVS